MKALIYTIFVMTIVVWGFPVLELFVIKSGWGIFAGLIAILLLVLALSPAYIWYVLLRYTVRDDCFKSECKIIILFGMLYSIPRFWLVKPEDSGSLGMSTAIALTVFTIIFCFGLFQMTRPTLESRTRVMMYDYIHHPSDIHLYAESAAEAEKEKELAAFYEEQTEDSWKFKIIVTLVLAVAGWGIGKLLWLIGLFDTSAPFWFTLIGALIIVLLGSRGKKKSKKQR